MQIRDSRGTADLASRPADPTEADPSVRPLAAGPSMATRAIHGSLWTAVRFGAEYGLRMISSLILTRLLVPEAFGLMALISVLMTGLAMFSDMGISSSVVQSKRGDDPAYLNTAWTLQVIRGFVLWIFAALFADAMALGCGSYDAAYLRAALDSGAQIATLDKKLMPHLTSNKVRRWEA